MAVTGKMTVDLYANPDPFVQGMKAVCDKNSHLVSLMGDELEPIQTFAQHPKKHTEQVRSNLGCSFLLETLMRTYQ